MLGEGFLVVGLATSILAGASLWLNRQKIAYIFLSTSALSLTLAVLLLGYYFAAPDFRLAYVWEYASLDLPLYLRLSAILAGDEGFLLLLPWIIVLSAFHFRNKLNDAFVKKVVLITIVVGAFFTALALHESPFESIYDAYSVPKEIIPPDGRGLNAALIDLWMAVHPPLVVLAYGFLVIPFAAALVFLWTGEDGWEEFSRTWSRMAWLFLTLSIGFGGWWSYKKMTFGDFWHWDPVETSSLVPWLLLTAGLHAAVEYRRSRSMGLYTPVLMISSFAGVLFSMYISRSATLVSYHTYIRSALAGWVLLALLNILWIGLVLAVDFHTRANKKDASRALVPILSFIIAQLLIGLYRYFQGGLVLSLPTQRELLSFFIILGILFFSLRLFFRGKTSPAIEEPPLVTGDFETSLITLRNLNYLAVILLSMLSIVALWGLVLPIAKVGVFSVREYASARIEESFFNKWSFPFMVFLVLVLPFYILLDKLGKKTLLGASFATLIISLALGRYARIAERIVEKYGGEVVAFWGGKTIPKGQYFDYSLLFLVFALLAVAYIILIRGKRGIKLHTSHYIHLGVVLILIGSMVSTLFDTVDTMTFSYPDDLGLVKNVGDGYAVTFDVKRDTFRTGAYRVKNDRGLMLSLESLEVLREKLGVLKAGHSIRSDLESTEKSREIWVSEAVIKVYKDGKFLSEGRTRFTSADPIKDEMDLPVALVDIPAEKRMYCSFYCYRFAGFYQQKERWEEAQLFIHRGLFYDVLVKFIGGFPMDEDSLALPITVKQVPGINLVWLGITLLALGEVVILTRRSGYISPFAERLECEYQDLVSVENAPYGCDNCGACFEVCDWVKCVKGYDVEEDIFGGCCLCYDTCPWVSLDKEGLDRKIFGELREEPIGVVKESYSVKVLNPSENVQDAGFATALVKFLLSEGIVNAAILTGRDEKWVPKPFIATTEDEVDNSAGSKYSANPLLSILGDANKYDKVALVGQPCHIQALRKLQQLGWASNVTFVIGIFCSASFSYSGLREYVGAFEGVDKFDIDSGKFIALREGKKRASSLKDLLHYLLPICRPCRDFSAEFADISVGSIGSKIGENTVLIRAQFTQGIFDSMVERKLIESRAGDLSPIEKYSKDLINIKSHST
ncbi:MAG: Coenzyme F420 hydrogenase/dehydrogenase, beta subunit C-terminal domain [Candidatus Hydrothermarchaeales archaeon]